MNEKIRVRFAPSPTGYLHVGGLRTALYNYLFARKNKGTFILRIEDTDRSRYVEGAVENLLHTLEEVGISFDEGPFYQSQRTDIYRKYGDKLLENDSAYHCFCTPEELEQMRENQTAGNTGYDGRCRKLSPGETERLIESGKPYVIRAKMPTEGVVEFDDIIRGKISFRWDMVEDQILLKSDGYPTYHLANVVDDYEMGVTHIIRGEEWLTSTPKHIFLYEALGLRPPIYAHLPLLLNPDKSKLSKRQGDVAVEDFLAKGFVPEALINYIALLGWHSAEDREIFTLSELEQEFSLERINKAGAVFDQEKLKWMNGYYIHSLDDKVLGDRVRKYYEAANIDISDEDKYSRIVAYVKERITLLLDIVPETEMFYNDLDLSTADLSILRNEKTTELFQLWIDELAKLEKIDEDTMNELLKKSTEKLAIKGKNLYFPLRLALYGKEHGPNIPIIFVMLSKEESLKRLAYAKELSLQ